MEGQELPVGWSTSTGSEIFELVTSGSRGWAKYYSDDGPLFIRIGNLDHGSVELDLKDVQRVTPPNDSEGKRTRLEPNDILISITAELGTYQRCCPLEVAALSTSSQLTSFCFSWATS